MAEGGELDGALGVFAAAGDEVLLNDTVLPLLDELGIEPVEVAINDAAPDDVAGDERPDRGHRRALRVRRRRPGAGPRHRGPDVGQRCRIAGLPAAAAADRPELDPGLRGRPGPPRPVGARRRRGREPLRRAQNLWSMDNMQACIERVEAGGGSVPEPDTVPEEDSDLWVAGFTACRNVVLLQALLEAAGEDLNYGSFAAAAEGLEVDVPVQPEPLTFGPAAGGGR